MKEAIITDLDGFYVEPTLVDDAVTGVFPLYQAVEAEEDEEPQQELYGYQIAVSVPSGLYKPRYDFAAWEAAVEAYNTAMQGYSAAIAAYDPDSEGDPPQRPEPVNLTVFWVEGKDTADLLEQARTAKIAQLNAACNAEILAGFTSSALGDEHSYDFDYEAQINLAGMMQAINNELVSEPIIWKASGIPTEHTFAQFTALFADGLAYKNNQIQRYWMLKSAAEEATSSAELVDITW